MTPARRYFRDFFCGRSGDQLIVATLRDQVGVLISARTLNVKMKLAYAQKMLVKHRLTYEHLHIVQLAIDKGYCFVGTKPNHIEFLYFDNKNDNDEYLLVIKSARWGEEVWFVTFHRTRKQQYRSKSRYQKLLRGHL